MHDPMTVAFEIRYPRYKYKPWPKAANRDISQGWKATEAWSRMSELDKVRRAPHWPDGYRESFITIWHVDPERYGSDDSCGFCVPHLTDKQRERLKNWAWSESRDPYFLKTRGREWPGSRSEAECIYRALLLHVAKIIDIEMTFEQAANQASMTIHNPDCIDAASRLCFEPGYHTNFPKDSADHRQEHFLDIISGMARWILKDRRPWYRHPKWHFWHWKLQCHPLQQLKRRLFSRCEVCGKAFAYGESPISGSWDSDGPRWFRSEENIRHNSCDRNAGTCLAAQTT